MASRICLQHYFTIFDLLCLLNTRTCFTMSSDVVLITINSLLLHLLVLKSSSILFRVYLSEERRKSRPGLEPTVPPGLEATFYQNCIARLPLQSTMVCLLRA